MKNKMSQKEEQKDKRKKKEDSEIRRVEEGILINFLVMFCVTIYSLFILLLAVNNFFPPLFSRTEKF